MACLSVTVKGRYKKQDSEMPSKQQAVVSTLHASAVCSGKLTVSGERSGAGAPRCKARATDVQLFVSLCNLPLHLRNREMTGSMRDSDEDFSHSLSDGSGGEKGSSGEGFSQNLSLALISRHSSSVEAQHEGSFSRSLRENTSSPSGFDGNRKGNESLRTRILSLFLFSQSVLLSISPWL